MGSRTLLTGVNINSLFYDITCSRSGLIESYLDFCCDSAVIAIEVTPACTEYVDYRLSTTLSAAVAEFLAIKATCSSVKGD